MTPAPKEIVQHSPDETEIVVVVRDLLSLHPEAVGCGPETLAGLMWMLRLLPRRPSEFEVGAALEALMLEGEVAA